LFLLKAIWLKPTSFIKQSERFVIASKDEQNEGRQRTRQAVVCHCSCGFKRTLVLEAIAPQVIAALVVKFCSRMRAVLLGRVSHLKGGAFRA
jgi:hypothetical protein